ncbi:MAG: PKD domain-containing protein, partial [Flavobacteriales bacterium]
MEALKNFIFLVLAGFIFLFPQESFANCLNVTPSFSSSRTSICGVGPHVINFTNTSTGVNSNTAGYQWYLNGNQFANTTGIGNSVSDTITIIGIYNYTLVAYDTANFCTDTAFFSVTITERPLSAFSFPVGPLCPNSPISFTNNSTNTVPGTRYLWRFGDGTTDTSQNPTHSYGRGGNFTVSFRVFNSDSCSAGSNQMISILNTPNINISGDDGDGNTFRCLNAIDTVSQETVTFFNNSAPGITYTWDFGDGSPTVTQTSATSPDTVIHKFTSYGTFPVVCSAIDSNGCLYTDTVFVVFDKFISASFSVPLANISGCAPHVVTPINVSINATRYEWDFGDGSPIINTTDLSSPSYTYDSTGTYYIRLRAINDCGFSVSTVGPITVARSPEID